MRLAFISICSPNIGGDPRTAYETDELQDCRKGAVIAARESNRLYVLEGHLLRDARRLNVFQELLNIGGIDVLRIVVGH